MLNSAGSIPTGSEHQSHTSNYEAPDIATPADDDEEVIATHIILKEEEWLGISRAGDSGHQSCDKDMRDSQDTDETDGPGCDIGDSNANDSDVDDSNANDSNADDSNADDSNADDSNADDSDSDNSDADDSNADDNNVGDSDTEMFDINDGDSNIDDGVEASDSDVEDTNPGTNDMADSKTEGTNIVLVSRASSPDATDCKKHILSLVCDSCSNLAPRLRPIRPRT